MRRWLAFRAPAGLGTRVPLAVLAVLALGGCGGGGGGALSMIALRAHATRVCVAANSQTNRIPAPMDPAGEETFLSHGVGVLTPELTRLRSLTPSGDAASVYSAAIKAFAEKLGALRTTIGALHRGADPVIAINALQQRLTPIESDEDDAWQALGIPACENR